MIETLVGPNLGEVRLQLARGTIIWGRAIEPNAFFSRNWGVNNGGGSLKGSDFLFKVFYFLILFGLPIYKGVEAINLAD
jgi:hypothetical protein